MSDEKPEGYCNRCEGCHESEAFADLKRCADCGHLFCLECIEWCCDEHDVDNGDWFCLECLENGN